MKIFKRKMTKEEKTVLAINTLLYGKESEWVALEDATIAAPGLGYPIILCKGDTIIANVYLAPYIPKDKFHRI